MNLSCLLLLGSIAFAQPTVPPPVQPCPDRSCAPPMPVIAEPQPVPAFDETGVLLLIALFAGTAAIVLGRKR